jgi:hypothetical protein
MLYFANSGDQALELLDREIVPEVLAVVVDAVALLRGILNRNLTAQSKRCGN